MLLFDDVLSMYQKNRLATAVSEMISQHKCKAGL